MLNVLQPVWLEMGLHEVTYADLYINVHKNTSYIYKVYIIWMWSPAPNNLPPLTLCSWSSVWNDEENNYHVSLQSSSILVCFLFRGNLILPSIHCTVLPRNVMANITVSIRDNTVIEREKERSGKKTLFKMASPAVNIWQISEVKINLESHQLKGKKGTATGTIHRA